MDRGAVNVARREATTVSGTLVQIHETELMAHKEKLKESVLATDRLIPCAANLMNVFHDKTQTASTASDALVHSGIDQGFLDNCYRKERTRGFVLPLPSIVRSISKKKHLRRDRVHHLGSAIQGNTSI